MDIINVGAADLQGPKRSSESAAKKLERPSEKESSRGVFDRLSLSAASMEMAEKLRKLSEELYRIDPIRREKVEEVKERLLSGELESDDALREAAENLLELLDLERDSTDFPSF